MGQSQKLNIQPRSRSPLVHLAGIRKSFDGKTVIDNLNLTINNGEFLTLLGPSGCGKTTVLRLIAGLENVDSGRIHLEDHDITHVPAENRHVNTVFQSYALFPHMTVFENVAFGLRMQKTPAAEITPRVMDALKMVQLEAFAQRKPHQLSGGQQQRVAIARAVVNKPRLLLLDESLSALDYKLRKQMQNELKALQRKLGITFVFVTHDQEEAFALSDRVMVGLRISQRYQHLVRNNSVFWLASGYSLDFGLTGGVVKTGTFNQFIRGGIAFATPPGTPLAPKAQAGKHFLLLESEPKEWREWGTALPR